MRASHVWKRFRADRRYSQLRYEIKHIRARVHGGDPDHWRWALRDVDVDIAPGQAIGLLGSNGSGKSTLLKILSRIMQPYAGKVEVSGRVGALIEVIAGIHPDLSGRENLFLYGILLGLSRPAIAARFDEIVEFAEVGGAIDRQVKFYSSGMKMRLGFSVAAFLEPDILLVDEVLAVGDAAFQQKCLERMRTVLNQGTTLVFVSHDLAAMEATCSRGIWLRDGVAEIEGPIRPVLGAYRRAIEEAAQMGGRGDEPVRLSKVEVAGPDGGVALSDDEITITARIQSIEAVEPVKFYIGVSEGTATPIFVVSHLGKISMGDTTVRCTIPRLPLPRGRYYVWAGVGNTRGRDVIAWQPAATFDVHGPALDDAPLAVVRLSPVRVDTDWALED